MPLAVGRRFRAGIAGDERAVLELLDVTGRRVAVRDLSAPARAAMGWTYASRCPPGSIWCVSRRGAGRG